MQKYKAIIKKMYSQNRIFVWSITLITVFTVIYLSLSTANVPIMDYWRYICDFTDKIFKGEFSFLDLWETMGGHRGGIAYLFVAINIAFFKMNTLVGIYGGVFITFLTGIILYKYYNKIIYSKKKRLKQYLFLIILIELFNYNQWEILTLAFSFSFAIRRVIFLSVFFIIENSMLYYDKTRKWMPEIMFILLIVTCFVSTGYLPGMLGAVIFTLGTSTILNAKYYGKKFPKHYIGIIGVIIIGLLIYIKGLDGIGQEGQSLVYLIEGLVNGNLFKGIFIMLGSSVLHVNIASQNMLIYVGILIFSIYILAIFIYFHSKMWKTTYVPLMLMAYTGVTILTIYYARANVFELQYLASSRYVYETTLGLIGISLIFIKYVCDIEDNKLNNSFQKLPIYVLTIVSLIIIFSILLISYSNEIKTSVHRKAYQMTLIEMMLNIDDYTDDELIPFQANEPQQVRKGVELMKKYKLGIFKNIDNYTYVVK